jgi:hypothetical protein
VVQLLAHRAKARLDIPQALATRELREDHGQKLVSARELTETIAASIAIDALLELTLRKKVHQLSEQKPAVVHSSSPPVDLVTGKV